MARVLVLTGVPQKTPVMAWQEKDLRISEAAAKEKAGKWDCGIVWCCDAAMAAAQVTTEFVTVISAGETWHGNALEQAVQYLSSVQDTADAVLCEHVTRKTPAKDGASAGGKVVSLTKAKEILRLPGSLHGILFVPMRFVKSCRS